MKHMCYQVINNGLEGPDYEALLREEGKGRGYHKPRGGNLIILGDSLDSYMLPLLSLSTFIVR